MKLGVRVLLLVIEKALIIVALELAESWWRSKHQVRKAVIAIILLLCLAQIVVEVIAYYALIESSIDHWLIKWTDEGWPVVWLVCSGVCIKSKWIHNSVAK